MSDPEGGPEPPADVPQSLIDAIDSLDVSELKAVAGYVQRRIGALHRPIEEAIEAESAGEVIDVEDHGAYAVVRQHPPNADGSGVNTDVVSLYHVRREPELDGEERLHWAYIGELARTAEVDRRTCRRCGHHVEASVDVCPHCGRTIDEQSKTED